MHDDMGQQRLQRVAPAGGQQAVATKVEATQEGLDEEMTEVPAASRASDPERPRGAAEWRIAVEKPRIRRGGSSR